MLIHFPYITCSRSLLYLVENSDKSDRSDSDEESSGHRLRSKWRMVLNIKKLEHAGKKPEDEDHLPPESPFNKHSIPTPHQSLSTRIVSINCLWSFKPDIRQYCCICRLQTPFCLTEKCYSNWTGNQLPCKAFTVKPVISSKSGEKVEMICEDWWLLDIGQFTINI